MDTTIVIIQHPVALGTPAADTLPKMHMLYTLCINI